MNSVVGPSFKEKFAEIRTCGSREQCTDPQISFLATFFIKNGSYDIIHTFKNYFVIVFSIFNFQF